jgi:hypothetical protein
MLGRSVILFTMLSISVFGQRDSVLYDPSVKLEDGIYLNYYDFRKNVVIPQSQIETEINKEQLDFFTKLLSRNYFSYKKNEGFPIQVASKSVYGYIQNNTFYINYKGEFYRVPVFGAISYFIGTFVVTSPVFNDPRFGYPPGSSTTTELREFIINFYDGYVNDLDLNKVKELLSRDKALYNEFRKLSRRKQKKEVYRFIRRYNQLHPIYFLKET